MRRFLPRAVFAASTLGAVWLLLGCDTTPLTASLLPQAARHEEANELLSQGVRALHLGDRDGADRKLNQALYLFGDESEAAVAIADRLLEEGKPEKAASLLESATSRAPLSESPWAWGTLSRAWQLYGDQIRAKAARERAESLAKDALQTISQAIPDNERQVRVRRWVSAGGYYRDVRKDAATALQLLRAAVKAGPNPPLPPIDRLALAELGYTLVRYGSTASDQEEGVRLLQTAAKSAPESIRFRYRYGWALLQTGDYIGAQRVLREAVDLAPSDAESHFHLGTAYRRQGKLGAALLEYERALLLRPHYAEALAEYQNLRGVSAPAPTASPAPAK